MKTDLAFQYHIPTGADLLVTDLPVDVSNNLNNIWDKKKKKFPLNKRKSPFMSPTALSSIW